MGNFGFTLHPGLGLSPTQTSSRTALPGFLFLRVPMSIMNFFDGPIQVTSGTMMAVVQAA